MTFKEQHVHQNDDGSWAFAVKFKDQDGYGVTIHGGGFKTREGADAIAQIKKMEIFKEHGLKNFYNEEEFEDEEDQL